MNRPSRRRPRSPLGGARRRGVRPEGRRRRQRRGSAATPPPSPPTTAAPAPTTPAPGPGHDAAGRRPGPTRRRDRRPAPPLRRPTAPARPPRRRRAGPFEPGAERHRRRLRHRDRDRHPRPGHRRLADPAGRASTSARTSTGSSSPPTHPDRLFGRNVRVVFRDDEFNPQNAVQVCREMVEQEGAFLLVGGGGADQITACAQYANENGIPYLSAGVNETGLTDLDTYFATTLTYAEQAPMIIAQLQAQGFTEAGLVVADTPSFDDADGRAEGGGVGGRAGHPVRDADQQGRLAGRVGDRRPAAQGLRRRGRHPAQLAGRVRARAGAAARPTRATRRCGSGPASPAASTPSRPSAVRTWRRPSSSRRRPGSTSSTSSTPTSTPPTPQYADGAPADDIGLQLWSLNKAVALMLEATGAELGRAAFMNTLVTTDAVRQRHLRAAAVHGRRPLRRHRRPPAAGRLRRQAVRHGRASSSQATS